MAAGMIAAVLAAAALAEGPPAAGPKNYTVLQDTDFFGPSSLRVFPPLCIHCTRAGIEWRRCHHAVCMARPYAAPHHPGGAEP